MAFEYIKVQKNMYLAGVYVMKFLARIFRSGTIEPEVVTKEIAQSTGISEGVILAVLKEVEIKVGQALENGQAVKFPSLGMFVPTFDADAKSSLSQVNTTTIHNYRVRFVPSKYLKNVAKNTHAKEASMDISGLQPGSKNLTEEEYNLLMKLRGQEEELEIREEGTVNFSEESV
ncbi:MAG: HU family DNA-binding protein [Bacteroidales bacterium]|nr:HU family DNA-binding protein [Bacteroidales bacterium]